MLQRGVQTLWARHRWNRLPALRVMILADLPLAVRHVWAQASVPIIQKLAVVDKRRHVCTKKGAHMRTIEWGSEIEHALSVVGHEGLKTRKKPDPVLRMFCQADEITFCSQDFAVDSDLTCLRSGVIIDTAIPVIWLFALT